MSEPSVRETAARAAFEMNPPRHRHDGSDATWHEATVSPWAGHWVREVEMARRQGDAVLAAVADHDGLADVLRGHRVRLVSCGGKIAGAACSCDWQTDHGWSPEGAQRRADAHLADVIRAWLRGDL